MAQLRTFVVLGVFGISTFLLLNWLLDRNWNWQLIGYITVSIFACIVSISIGALIAHLILSLFHTKYDPHTDSEI